MDINQRNVLKNMNSGIRFGNSEVRDSDRLSLEHLRGDMGLRSSFGSNEHPGLDRLFVPLRHSTQGKTNFHWAGFSDLIRGNNE
jgi:hypothetical protein